MDQQHLTGRPVSPADEYGIITRRRALDDGFDDNEIQRLVLARVWRRLRRGVYVEAARWESSDPADRHLLEIRAALTRVRETAAVSHWSAGVVHDLAMYEPGLSTVHLTRTDLHSSRIEAGVNHHVAGVDMVEVPVLDGIPTTSVARTVVDIARRTSFEAGVVTADDALRRRGLDPDDLRAQLFACNDWVGARTAGRVVAFADGRSESPGESLTRVVFHEQRLPAPELQVELT